jgi:succinoglycan biosynthesis transport protein ExoP
MLVPPKYAASTQLLFDAVAEQLVSPEQELKTNWWSNQVFQSAAGMIESPGILKPVALKIKSQSARYLSPETSLQKILTNPDLSDEERTAGLIERLQKSLTVKTPSADQVIVLEYKSSSPSEAASVANLIAATFIEQREASRKASLAQATEWLDERSLEAKDRLIAVDKKIQEFKVKHRIESETGSSALETELTHERDQLSAVRTRLAEAQTVYSTLHTYASGDAKDYERLAESIGGATLERLRSTLADAQAGLASAKARLGAFHPDVKAKESHVAAISAEITAEARRKLLTSKIEMEQLTSREQTLREEIKDLESKVSDLRASEVQLLELQREREATKTVYDAMLAKLMQTGLQQTLNFARFRILLDATVPKNSKLPPAFIWFGGVISGLVFGLFGAIAWELLQGRLVMFNDVRKQLPAMLITQVPVINKRDFNGACVTGQSSYQSFAKEFPSSLFANKLLAAQMAVNAMDVDEKCKAIMITSPMQGNGKSHISSNLAGLSVLLGAKTLLVDLDARKDTKNDEVAGEPKCSELRAFLHENDLEELFTATHRTEIGDYDVLRVRASNEAACLRFYQTKITELLNFVRRNYDYVWIDTPPVLIFNDPLIIARQVDGILVVAEWSVTTMRQLKDTINLIQESGGYALGVIINKVRVDSLISESMMSYADYYSGKKK